MLPRPLDAATTLAIVLSSLAPAPSIAQVAQTTVVADAASLLREVPNLRAGATLLLAPGTYEVPSLVLRGLAGRPDAWITIRGHGAGATRIVGTAAKNVVDVTDCSYVRLEDLEITCTGAHADIDGVKFAYDTNSRHFTLEGCRIVGTTGNGVSSQAASLDRLTLHRCEIANVRASGVYLGYDSPLRLATNTTIRGCWIHDVAWGASPHYGIQIKGGSFGARIEDNVLHDVPAANAAAIAVYYADAAGRQPPERWNVVRGNAIWRCGSEGIYATNSAVIADNVLVDVASGIVTTSYGGKVVDNLQIVHNTVLRSTAAGLYLGGFDHADASCVVANNASLTTAAGAEALRAAVGVGSATFTGNVCHGVVYGPGLAAGVIQAQAPVVELVRADATTAAEQLDPTPRPGSALHDAVDGALGAARDFAGGRRPRTAGADAGAIEQGAAGAIGWPLGAGFKPAVDALTPPVQAIDAGAGGVAQFALDVDAPPGTPVLSFPSLAGPSAGGGRGAAKLVGVIPDFLTLAPFSPGMAGAFEGYVTQVGPDGRAAMQLRLPRLVLLHRMCVYQCAVVLPANGPVAASNVVRVLLQ